MEHLYNMIKCKISKVALKQIMTHPSRVYIQAPGQMDGWIIWPG